MAWGTEHSATKRTTAAPQRAATTYATRETEPNRREPQPTSQTAASPHAVVPAGGRPLILGTHQTLPPAARPNACAVTRTDAPPQADRQPPTKRMRSDSDRCALLPTNTASRQRCGWRTIELRHPRGHRTVREAIRKCLPWRTRRTTALTQASRLARQAPAPTNTTRYSPKSNRAKPSEGIRAACGPPGGLSVARLSAAFVKVRWSGR